MVNTSTPTLLWLDQKAVAHGLENAANLKINIATGNEKTAKLIVMEFGKS